MLLEPPMTCARVIDGKALAKELITDLAGEVADFRARHGFAPGLAVVLVGDDPASTIYVRRKAEQCGAVGMVSEAHVLPANTSQESLMALIVRLNRESHVHGILVQLPLPRHIDEFRILQSIDPSKDVDGFHVQNAGLLAVGRPFLTPCTPLGCLRLLRHSGVELRGKRALVVGRSVIVGRPMAQLLLMQDCTVTIAHRYSADLPDLCREADILVVAVGIPGLIRGAWIKAGAVILDVGINRVAPVRGETRSRIVGDVAYHEVQSVAGAVTPVPGGVGPMTIACLLKNTLAAAMTIEGDDVA